MSTGIKRPYEQVFPIAQRVVDALAPACEWIQLAGSLRRQKAMIGDVEIVAVSTDGRLYEALDARLADGKISHLPKKRWGQKRRINGVDGEQGDAELGSMFEQVEAE